MAGTVMANVPLYDPVIVGFPLYLIIIFVLVTLLGFGLMIVKLEIYDRLEPVWGHREASMRNIPEAIVHGMSGKIWLMPVDSVAGIFSAMGLPMKWIQTIRTQGQLGKVNTIELSDDWNIVHNIDIDYAIVESAAAWNKKMKKEGHNEEDKKEDGSSYFIYDWDSYKEHLMNGDLDLLFPAGVKMPPFRIVDMYEVKRYLPIWSASHFSGHIMAELEKRKPEEDATKQGMTLMKYALVAAAIFGSVVILAFLLMRS